MKAITEQDTIASSNEVILGVLSSILDGTNNSWRYNVYCRKTSLEGVETIDRDDLKFNVTFGDFDELSLCYASTNCKTFSKGSKVRA